MNHSALPPQSPYAADRNKEITSMSPYYTKQYNVVHSAKYATLNMTG